MKPNPSLKAYVQPREPDKETPHVVYLAAPFTSGDPEVQRARKQATMALSDRMVRQGSVVFSPLEYTQSMQARGVFPPQGWYDFDIAIMKGCHEVLVLALPGWDRSHGVIIETATARALGIPVNVISMEEAQITPGLRRILEPNP